MPDKQRTAVSELIRKLKQERDELKLKMHLGKEDLKDEWDELQKKLSALSDRFEPLKDAVDETADNMWESFKLVGSEIRDGFNRIRKSL